MGRTATVAQEKTTPAATTLSRHRHQRWHGWGAWYAAPTSAVTQVTVRRQRTPLQPQPSASLVTAACPVPPRRINRRRVTRTWESATRIKERRAEARVQCTCGRPAYAMTGRTRLLATWLSRGWRAGYPPAANGCARQSHYASTGEAKAGRPCETAGNGAAASMNPTIHANNNAMTPPRPSPPHLPFPVRPNPDRGSHSPPDP